MVVTKAMKQREVNSALRDNECKVVADDGPHTKWRCPCGQHSVNVPRHKVISPGVIRDFVKRLSCLGEGWLQ